MMLNRKFLPTMCFMALVLSGASTDLFAGKSGRKSSSSDGNATKESGLPRLVRADAIVGSPAYEKTKKRKRKRQSNSGEDSSSLVEQAPPAKKAKREKKDDAISRDRTFKKIEDLIACGKYDKAIPELLKVLIIEREESVQRDISILLNGVRLQWVDVLAPAVPNYEKDPMVQIKNCAHAVSILQTVLYDENATDEQRARAEERSIALNEIRLKWVDLLAIRVTNQVHKCTVAMSVLLTVVYNENATDEQKARAEDKFNLAITRRDRLISAAEDEPSTDSDSESGVSPSFDESASPPPLERADAIAGSATDNEISSPRMGTRGLEGGPPKLLRSILKKPRTESLGSVKNGKTVGFGDAERWKSSKFSAFLEGVKAVQVRRVKIKKLSRPSLKAVGVPSKSSP